MKSLREFINEGNTAVEDLIKMIEDFINGKDVPSKKDIIVTAKLVSSLDGNVRSLKKGARYLYTEFEDNKLSRVAFIDPDDKSADVHDGKEFYSLVDDEFIDEFGYFMSGSDKGLDMRIWRDIKSQITGSIEL